MKKTAFTFIELLLAIALTGIVGTIAIKTVKIGDKTYKYAISNVYHNLDVAVYNAAAMSCDPFYANNDNNDDTNALCKNKKYSDALCEGLTSQMTTAESNCDRAPYSLSDRTFDEPHIKLINGTNLYIVADTSTSANKPFEYSFDLNGLSYGGEFYFVFADINGRKAPNTMSYERDSKYLPDTYAFAIIDSHRAVPIGALEDDKRLITARYSYVEPPNASESAVYQDDAKYSPVSVTYAQAQAQAWGYYTHSDYTTRGNEIIPTLENPYSYNYLIREFFKNHNDANAHPAMYSASGVLLEPSIPPGDEFLIHDDMHPNEKMQHGCDVTHFENCNVVIDKYLF